MKKETFSCESVKDVPRKRLFIENDLELRDDIKHSVERCVRCHWETFFTKTILNAGHAVGVKRFFKKKIQSTIKTL